VTHLSGSGILKGLTISDELQTVWAKILSDADPTTWVYCEYDPSGACIRMGPGSQKQKALSV
jgi:hypothetical protein